MGKVEAPESEKRGGTQTYLKVFPGEGIPAASKPATRFQKHDAQSRTHDPGSQAAHVVGTTRVSQSIQL